MDGVKTRIVPTDLALNGLVMSPGSHRVELRYVPSSLYLGAAISTITALLWLSACLTARRRRGSAES